MPPLRNFCNFLEICLQATFYASIISNLLSVKRCSSEWKYSLFIYYVYKLILYYLAAKT